MAWKKYISATILLTFLFTFLIALINYIVDPYYIFHSNFLKTNEYINERYNKIEYLKTAHNKYNSYIFGSSRASCLVNKEFEENIPNSHFYNMTMSVATLSEIGKIFKYMINNNYPIKNVVLSVDMDINLDYDFHNNDYLRYNHYLITKENPLLFYYRYLSAFSFKVMEDKIKVNFGLKEKTPHAFYDLQNSGRFFFKVQEEKIKKNPEGYIKNNPALNINMVQRDIFIKKKAFENNMKSLKEIADICKKRDINLIVLIPPHNYNTMNKMDLQAYFTLLKEIVKIHPFWNFSGYNKITMDNHNYYEATHFRPLVSKFITDRIFGKSQDKEFGEYVTKENIKEHLHKKFEEIKREEKRWFLKTSSLFN